MDAERQDLPVRQKKRCLSPSTPTNLFKHRAEKGQPSKRIKCGEEEENEKPAKAVAGKKRETLNLEKSSIELTPQSKKNSISSAAQSDFSKTTHTSRLDANEDNHFQLPASTELSGQINVERRHPESMLIKIIRRAYKLKVAPKIDVLRESKPWSSEVYGELKSAFVTDIIEKTNMRKSNVFIDFGCGVGNVLLQVAAQVGCPVYGVEMNPDRYNIAKEMVEAWRTFMRRSRLPHGRVEIFCANGLECQGIYELLCRSGQQKVVILVNNLLFDEETTLNLLQLFLVLENGSKIVTTKSLEPGRRRSNGEYSLNLHSSENMANRYRFETREYKRKWVSWKDEGGEYYIATVDLERLRTFAKKVSRRGTRTHR